MAAGFVHKTARAYETLSRQKLYHSHSSIYRTSTTASTSGRGLLVTAQSTAVDVCKAKVMRVVSGTARGKATTAEQRASILGDLEALEALNTERDPARSDLLSGMWALLYQAPLDEARAKVDKSGTTEGPFLAAFQPLTKDLVRTKNNLQLIDLPRNRVENLAEFVVAGRWEGLLNIIGSVRVHTPGQGERADRVDVEFEEFVLRLGPSWVWRVPLTWVRPKGWIKTTYLDKDMRVGRGDKKSIFVTSRIKDGRPWPGSQ